MEPKLRFEWHIAITKSKNLSEGTKMTAYALWDHVNEERGAAVRVSEKTLALERGKDERTIRRHMTELMDLGYIERTRKRNGFLKLAAEYRLTLPDIAMSGKGLPVIGHSTTPYRTATAPLTGHVSASLPDIAVSGQQGFQENLSRKEFKKAVVADATTPTPAVADAPDLFKEFFEAMPKRVDESKAKAAWRETLKLTTAENLLSCAGRYRDECAGKESRFVSQPANWLTKGKWRDFELVDYLDEYDNKRQRTRAEQDAADKAEAERVAKWW
jgi:hypothetical protein